jgi:hypothetical protein
LTDRQPGNAVGEAVSKQVDAATERQSTNGQSNYTAGAVPPTTSGAGPSKTQASGGLGPDSLRFIFVTFLFAVAIERVSTGVIHIIESASHAHIAQAITHLILAFLIITTSWTSWAANTTSGPHQLKDIFSQEYLLLLLDLALVILYIYLVSAAEIPTKDHPDPTPSAIPESRVLALIYAIYVLWDLSRDIFQKASSSRPSVLQFLTAIVVRCGASTLCMLLALIIVYLASTIEVRKPNSVCWLNVAEMANAVLFRSIKVYEFRFDARLHQRFREEKDKFADKRGCFETWVKVSAFAYVAASVHAMFW